MNPINNDDVAWSRNLFNTLTDGGVWGIPKTGTMFRKVGDKMVLFAQMPHEPGMPITQAELLAQQESMYEDCKRHFEAAGIKVEKGENL